jgi:hypothetical protein
MKGTMEAGARTLFHSLSLFNRAHEEWLQIWPGHGAGSSCGKGISAVPLSTLGYERRFNWAFKAANEHDFIAGVLAGQPDPPTYFATMTRMNKTGPPILNGFETPPHLDAQELAGLVARGHVVIDTRPATDFAAGFLPGTLNLPLTGSFVTWAGWLLPYTEPVYLVVGKGAKIRLPEIVRSLSLIGLCHRGQPAASRRLRGRKHPDRRAWRVGAGSAADGGNALVTSYKLQVQSPKKTSGSHWSALPRWGLTSVRFFSGTSSVGTRGALKSSRPVPSRTASSSCFKSIFDVTSMPAA